jgi:hypothetical protein
MTLIECQEEASQADLWKQKKYGIRMALHIGRSEIAAPDH